MDYVDWCLQAYITTITPITYSVGFHTVMQTVVFVIFSLGTVTSVTTFLDGTITTILQLVIIQYVWKL